MRRRGAGRDEEKERGWRETVARQAASGLSVREFCRQNSLSEPSFYGWRRMLAQRDAERAAPAKKHVAALRSGGSAVGKPSMPRAAKRNSSADRNADRPMFLPVALAGDFTSSAWEIISPAGWRVRLAEAPTGETLLYVLRFLSDRSLDSGLGRQEAR